MRTQSESPLSPSAAPTSAVQLGTPHRNGGRWYVTARNGSTKKTHSFASREAAEAYIVEQSLAHQAERAKRGFAAMPAERHREIASQGGRAAHERGTAHEFSPGEAQRAGAKGGATVLQKRGKEYFRALGRKGGIERGKRALARRAQHARSGA